MHLHLDRRSRRNILVDRMSRSVVRSSVLLWAALLVGFSLRAQCQGAQNAKREPIVAITSRSRATDPKADTVLDRRVDLRIDTSLVLIPVVVTDSRGRVVTGLERENFELLEDKVEQEIAQFSSDDVPVSVGIVFDDSGSMGDKLQTSQQAVAQFLKTANPDDEFFLIEFNDRPELTVPFTSESEKLQNRLMFTRAKGRTALLDAVYLAMHEMKKARNGRKAILLISDGGDNSSRYTEGEVRNAVLEADVQIYTIGIFGGFGTNFLTTEEMAGPDLLSDLAERTGGRHFVVSRLAELPDVAAKIGLQLRNQYVLAYKPTNNERNGKFRRVVVKLLQPAGLPRLKTSSRTGYYAPTQ